MALATKTKRPSAVHHRKRTGGHHRKTSKHYTKAYWPYLPLLGIAGFGLLLHTTLWQAPASGGVLAYATNTSSSALLEATNSQRQAVGKTALQANTQLAAAAQAKANDMAARNYWSHVTPDGQQPWWFVTNAGYQYQSTGENLAYGFLTSQATVNGWMNSPGHRANILSSDYQDVGFGIANAPDYQSEGQQTIVVAMYGRQFGQAQPVQQKPASTTVSSAPKPVATASPPAAAPVQPQAQPAPAPAPAAVAAVTVPKGSAQTAVLSSEQRREGEIAASRPVSRLEAMAQVSSVSVLALLGLASLAGAVFIARHMYFLHQALVKGERFVVKHWKLDIVIVAIVVAVILLTRTSGFIQ